MTSTHSTGSKNNKPAKLLSVMPLTALIASLSFGNVSFAQTTGNNQTLSGPSVVFGGQKNAALIQGQATLKNIVVKDGATTVTTIATGNNLNGFNVNSVTSDAGSLGAMQGNVGQILAVTEFLSVNGLPTSIDKLNSETRATGNAAGFGSTDATKPVNSLNLQLQMNMGEVTAKTTATGMTINTSASEREAVLLTVATGNSLATLTAGNASGQRQMNTGAVTSTTEFSTTGTGALTKLNVTTAATGNLLDNSKLGFVNFQAAPSGQGVQNNGGAITATTTINNTSVGGTNEALIRTFADGNTMLNSNNLQVSSAGSAPPILQNNSGNVTGTTSVNNFNANGVTTNAVTIINGNNLSNNNVQVFQQGSSTSPNDNILQQNSGRVNATTALYNTNFDGTLNVVTYATGNNARVSWDQATSNTSNLAASTAVLGSQINKGEVSAITTWTYDPTRNVTIDTRAYGNNMTLAPNTPAK